MSNAGGFKSLNRYYDMLAGNTVWNPWEPQGAFDALSTVTVGATAVSSITFAGIPNTYKHLQLRLMQKGTTRAGMSFNGDTTLSNYYAHFLYGTGSAAAAGAGASSWPISVGSAAGQFGVAVVDILDYTNTNKNKVWRSLTGIDENGSGLIILYSGNWSNTSAINSITIYPQEAATSPGSFLQHSQFTLYGVK